MPDYVNRPAIAENQERLAKPEKIAEIARSPASRQVAQETPCCSEDR
jgi:hypothetical protein